jgi:hypothetical protein
MPEENPMQTEAFRRSLCHSGKIIDRNGLGTGCPVCRFPLQQGLRVSLARLPEISVQ